MPSDPFETYLASRSFQKALKRMGRRSIAEVAENEAHKHLSKDIPVWLDALSLDIGQGIARALWDYMDDKHGLSQEDLVHLAGEILSLARHVTGPALDQATDDEHPSLPQVNHFRPDNDDDPDIYYDDDFHGGELPEFDDNDVELNPDDPEVSRWISGLEQHDDTSYDMSDYYDTSDMDHGDESSMTIYWSAADEASMMGYWSAADYEDFDEGFFADDNDDDDDDDDEEYDDDEYDDDEYDDVYDDDIPF